VPQDHKVIKDLLESLVPLVRKVMTVLLVQLVLLARKEIRDLLESREPPGHRVQQV